MNDNNVFNEELEDFEDEDLEDFDDEPEEIIPDKTAPAFAPAEEEKEKISQKKSSPAFEKIDGDEIEKQVKIRVNAWREATLTGENDDGRECALAHGLPDWDLTPPDMLVRRRGMK